MVVKGTKLEVTRLPIRLEPDPTRVIGRRFVPGSDARVRRIIERVMEIPEDRVEPILRRLAESFVARHVDIVEIVKHNYEAVMQLVPNEESISDFRRALIGACFTMEYSVEAAALFNPSMVPAMDQSGVPAGDTRFVMSLRATGEGHISSIVFRRGIVHADGSVEVDPPSPVSRQLEAVQDAAHTKEEFRQKLKEIGAFTEHTDQALAYLDDPVSLSDLNRAMEQLLSSQPDSPLAGEAERILWVARSNYVLGIPAGVNPAEVVIFPTSESESHGIEDLRLVFFTDDDGSHRLYGTYTAFDGSGIMPQLLEISTREEVRIHTMSGRCSQNKGMALFPRKLNGKYAMVGRIDAENLFLMYSDNVRRWDDAQIIQRPKYEWEVIQIGNCGSPIETEAGWLLLTHAVGPLRQYSIGASLLSLEDPSVVIGRTREPLMVATEEERSGYVPNVVYSCGGMIHGDWLIIPYAMSDTCSGIAKVPVKDLLTLLTSGRHQQQRES